MEQLKKMLEVIILAGRLLVSKNIKDGLEQYYVKDVTDKELNDFFQFHDFVYERATDNKEFFVKVQAKNTPWTKKENGRVVDSGVSEKHTIQITESTRIPVDSLTELF